MPSIKDQAGAISREVIADFAQRGTRLLNRVKDEDREVISRTLTRIVDEQALALVADDPTRHHANIAHLTNTMQSLAAKHGLAAQREAIEFTREVFRRVAEAAVEIAFSFVPGVSVNLDTSANPDIAAEPDGGL